jgi:hypothetical protein
VFLGQELFKLRLFVVQPDMDFIRKIVKHLQPTVVQLAKISLTPHQLRQDHKRNHLIVINANQNHCGEEVHALAVGNVGRKLGISGKQVVENVLPRVHWLLESKDVVLGESSGHVEADLLLDFEVVETTLFERKDFVFEAFVEVAVRRLDHGVVDAEEERPAVFATHSVRQAALLDGLDDLFPYVGDLSFALR